MDALFYTNLGSHKDKKKIGSDHNSIPKLNPIKFIPVCTMIELCDDIDEDLWIDDTIPIEFDYFATDDDMMEYMGAHSTLR